MKGNTNIEETLMTTLLKNGKVVNVFTNSLMEANVLFDDSGIILGVGDYDSADRIIDCSNKILSPSFIDGHIHIESTMLTPKELAKVCMAHGTGAIIADPHEIANVAGNDGIRYMLEASAGLPMKVFFMLPSCVPATPIDESGAILRARDLEPWYENPRVLGLAEMMNYPGVIHEDVQVLAKIKSALSHGKIVNGHAPLLRDKDLDAYIAKGIYDDHECSSFSEAKERIEKGQWVMIREGTTAHNLEGLIGLFEEPYCYRCLLVADDQHVLLLFLFLFHFFRCFLMGYQNHSLRHSSISFSYISKGRRTMFSVNPETLIFRSPNNRTIRSSLSRVSLLRNTGLRSSMAGTGR